MKWFKHNSNAHKGDALQAVYAQFGKARGYGLYFLLVEYLTDKWDGVSDPIFKINKNELSLFLGLKRNKTILFLVCLQNESDFSFKETDFVFEIRFPKLLEILHRDAIHAGLRPEMSRLKSSREENRREDSNSHGTETTTPTQNNSAQQFNDRFKIVDQKLIKFVESLIFEVINEHKECDLKHLSPSLARQIPKLVQALGSDQSRLSEWFTALLNSPKLLTLDGESWKRLVIGAIYAELR